MRLKGLDTRAVAVGTVLAGDAAGPARPAGEAVAALLGAAIGMLTLALVNLFTATSYGEMELLAAGAWLASWALLHAALRAREMALARWLVVFLVMVGVATTFIWPPVFEYVAGH